MGYTFAGWYDAATGGNKVTSITKGSTGNKTLYAKWTINSYDVNFESNGGSAVTKQTLNYNSTVTQPTAPTKVGYTFAGWFKETALTNAWNFSTDKVPANNITLYAKWTVNGYTMNFDSVGGSAVTSKTVNYGATTTAPTPSTKANATFEIGRASCRERV